MEPIADFELLSWWSDSDAIASSEKRSFGVNPPHPRLADTSLGWWGERISNHVLRYQGRLLDGMFLMRDHLSLQLRTSRGFLVIVSDPSGTTDSFTISIYYLLRDFQGCDWGMLHGREKETPLEWTRRVILKQWRRPDVFAPSGPEPLQDYRIEDGRNLAFKMHRYGWYRITLFERNPSRCLLSSWRFEHVSSYWQQPRYFCVRKIRRRYEGEDAALSAS